ncbi:uncharacterized protein buc2l isoform X2 [Anabas testudineus]|uniref:uncharacterized protein buc2l isoform X2 n=1 Tax=Anabas testudineus TaxID=64144 RepID=UPI000E45CE4C|nr:uncharacterized protein buc2l isoform X2 [Anabas testudineus]
MSTRSIRLNMNHPGGNLHSCTNTGIVNSGQQDAGLHNTCIHPGQSSHPRHIAARPIVYVHTPTPPPPPPPPSPFLHYQWPLPMPLFYNPLEGFPGTGYGIIMPPFPPFMEAPAYIMPYPHIQPVDYRRLLHPHVHPPTAPYQNPNQIRRIRPPYCVATETVNSEVQTEPTQRGANVCNYGDRNPLVPSDSGHGTASVSPSSSSSSQNRDSAEVDNFETCTLAGSNVRDFHVNNANTNVTVKHGFNILHPTGTQSVQASIRATLEKQKNIKDVIQENVPPCGYGNCNVWSVSSSDSIVPICSSFQQDDVIERRTSIADIQMSWATATPQATVLKMDDKMQPQNDLLPSETQTEHEKSVNQSINVAEGLLGSKDSECVYKILKLPLPQLRREDTNKTIPNQMSSNSGLMRKKLNESVWSVESLPLFIPTKEWLTQNGMFDPAVEEVEHCELSTQNEDVIIDVGKESSETCRFSLCDSVGTKSSCSPEKVALLNSPGVEKIIPTGLLILQHDVGVETVDGTCQQLCVLKADLKLAEVSPSKGHLVDCGVQCNKLQEKCLCEEMKSSMGPKRRHPFRFSDMKTNNGSTEGFYMTGHMQKNQGTSQGRNREKPSSQQEPHSRHSGKPGKKLIQH